MLPERWRELLAVSASDAAATCNAVAQWLRARASDVLVRPPQARLHQRILPQAQSQAAFSLRRRDALGDFLRSCKRLCQSPFRSMQLAPLPAASIPPAERAAALAAIHAEIGDCTRCPLAYAGRHKIVFGDGSIRMRG